MHRSVRLRLFTILLLIGVAVAFAAPSYAVVPAKLDVPEPLRPWIDWVMHGHEDVTCPFFPGTVEAAAGGEAAKGDAAARRRLCVWPARLELDLADRGGRFTQEWLVNRDGWVPLPGDAKIWPQEVIVDGRVAVVVAQDDIPSVRLTAGHHRLTGRFEWTALPPLVRVPPETGLLSLTVRGSAVLFPARDAEGRVWLQKQEGGAEEESRLDLTVHRRIEDDVPLRLLTRIDLRVSGRSREVALGRALPDGFVLMSLRGPLPTRIDQQGQLIVQVRPGSWTLEFEARHEGPVESVGPPPKSDPWPQDEIWVFQARPDLRQVTVEGAAAIDPQQTTLPSDWKSLPAYILHPGLALRLVERQRGDVPPAPDRLKLQRTLWLDFDGGGYTAHDSISGAFVRSWRLEMQAPAALGRVAIDGTDQVITRRAPDTPAGIEIRQGQAAIEADSRIPERRSVLSAVGWDADFQEAATTLMLPPGWRLLYATGIDDIDATWVSTWTLLDLFLVLVTTLAVAHLWGRSWGFLAFLALGSSWIEWGAPRWSWVAVVAAAALVRVLPEGRIRSLSRFLHLAASFALLLALVPFLVQQVRASLYPALEQPMSWTASLGSGGIGELNAGSGYETAAGRAQDAEGDLPRSVGYNAPAERLRVESAPSEAAGSVVKGVVGGVVGGVLGGMVSLEDKASTLSSNLALDPKASAQTGPGLPFWSWRRVALRWRGPVERGQQMHLFLLSPGVTALLGWMRVAVLALLAIAVLRRRPTAGGSLDGPSPTRRAGAAAVVAAAALPLLLAFTVTQARAADMPTPDLLDSLRQRLLEPPDCGNECVACPRLAIEATGATLRVRLEIHAATAVVAPLPGGADDWIPARVLLDGAPAAGLARIDGRLWVAVSPGTHQVILEGPLADRDAVSIPLPLRPRRVSAHVAGWRVEGLSDDGVAEETLQLVRLRPRGPGSGTIEPGSLPPFVRVERDLEIGLRWEARTQVVRLTPPGAAILIEVPLLLGESVTSADVRVAHGKAIVSLPPDAGEASWTSVLSVAPEIRLRAPDAVPWTEVWRATVGAVWHLEVEGIPSIHAGDTPALRKREWRPWPGESLVLHLTRPVAVEGRTLTIDNATLTISSGLRITDAALDLVVRASRGGEHALTLPEGAEVQALTINSGPQPIRKDGRQVVLPIVPGRQFIHIEWREPRGITAFFRTPEVSLGADSVNVTTVVALPANRWTLFLGGPRLGPAVLFWGLLTVSLLISIGLGTQRITPLHWDEWFLLSLGLTQIPIWASLAIVAWLLALGWRRRDPRAGALLFDAVQLLLAAWSLAALVLLFWAIQHGLLGLPEMQISGNGSSARDLRWYLDRTTGALPRPWVVSVPLLIYRLAMLAWALWLARAILRWLRWGWECISDGGLWRPLRRPRPPAPGAAPPVVTPPPAATGAPAPAGR